MAALRRAVCESDDVAEFELVFQAGAFPLSLPYSPLGPSGPPPVSSVPRRAPLARRCAARPRLTSRRDVSTSVVVRSSRDV